MVAIEISIQLMFSIKWEGLINWTIVKALLSDSGWKLDVF